MAAKQKSQAPKAMNDMFRDDNLGPWPQDHRIAPVSSCKRHRCDSPRCGPANGRGGCLTGYSLRAILCCPIQATGYAPIAQLVERLTLNQRVRGSSPCWRTISHKGYGSQAAFVTLFFRPPTEYLRRWIPARLRVYGHSVIAPGMKGDRHACSRPVAYGFGPGRAPG